MEQGPVSEKTAVVQPMAGGTIMSNALGIIRKCIFQFLLPLVALGPVMMGAEKLAELMGFHGSSNQFLRMIMMGVYAVIIFAVLRPRRKKPVKEGGVNDQ